METTVSRVKADMHTGSVRRPNDKPLTFEESLLRWIDDAKTGLRTWAEARTALVVTANQNKLPYRVREMFLEHCPVDEYLTELENLPVVASGNGREQGRAPPREKKRGRSGQKLSPLGRGDKRLTPEERARQWAATLANRQKRIAAQPAKGSGGSGGGQGQSKGDKKSDKKRT